MNAKQLLTLVLVLSSCITGYSQSVINTKHNLSTSAPQGALHSSTQEQVCIFCHTPHNSNNQAPLWNRNSSTVTYTLYDNSVSSSLDAITGQPDGASVLCLSCHDGTIALGDVVSSATDIFDGAGTKMPLGSKANLGINLSDDHPISFVYNSSLANNDGELKFPPEFPANVDHSGKLQCTSCHDPHDNSKGNFLLASTENSGLCIKCHDKTLWATASHNTSTATWNNSGTNPWNHLSSPYSTVGQNGCANCHSTHNAPGNAQILKSAFEENNCTDCHNGNVAQTNILAQLSKSYKHDVVGYNNIHKSTEGASFTKHVECADCHNPHASNNTPANAPWANGTLAGVNGIDKNGAMVSNVQYEYEVCFKCHAENSFSSPIINRKIVQSNTRLEFSTSAISFHPIETQGKNSNVPGLKTPLTESSMIYCTDCHASNGTAPNGPHGSIYPGMLKYNYETAEYTTESAQAYALCYSCHSRSQFTQETGDTFRRKVHFKHVIDKDVSCSACHDSHGISNTQGNATNNSHLINFNTAYVSPYNGQLYFRDKGNRSGECNLTCHGEKHDPESY